MNIFIKTLAFILLIPLFCISQQNTVVVFDSEESTTEFVLLAICENLTSTKVEYLSSDKSRMYLNIDDPININFSINKKQRPIYIFPGDSIIITKHENNIIFKGNRSKEWNYMSDLANKGYELIGNGWDFNTTNSDSILIEAKIKKIIILDEIDNVKDSLKFSLEFIKLLRRDIECSFLRSIIQQHNKNTKIDQNISNELFNYVLKFENIFKNDLCRNSYVFNFSLMSWSAFLARKETGFKAPKLSKTYNSGLKEDFAENFDLRIKIAQNMSEPMRSEIMYKLISFRFITNSWDEDYTLYVNKFNEISNDQKLIEQINSLAGKSYIPPKVDLQKAISSKDNILKTKLLETNEKSIYWKDLLQANRGKVLYIDVWASWCGPCIKEIRESHQFDKFIETQREKLTVVHLSIDENPDLWRKAIRIYGIENRQNYNMNTDSDLANLVIPDKIIPKYFIIDEDGKLLTDKAPSIGSRAFLEIMKKLIGEK